MIDDEKLKKKQSLKVIISEAIMVLAVVAMVTVLGFIVSGYWVNSDFEVERQGMLQVSSMPTGADLSVDGESSWLQRTNTSKIVSAGEHEVKISKEGYDSWGKKVNVTEGLLYRLHYPRLFLKERVAEKVFDADNCNFATISPNGRKLLLAGDTTEWRLVNLNNDKLEDKKIDLSKVLMDKNMSEDVIKTVFDGKIISADWDRNNDHVLMNIESLGKTEWLLLDVENPKNSLNITREFEADFGEVVILDDSSSNLLTLKGGDLQKIDVSGKTISEVLLRDVINFDHYEQDIIYTAKKNSGYDVGTFRLGDDEPVILKNEIANPVMVAIYRFYDDMYVAVLDNDTVNTYKKVDFEHVNEYKLGFVPAKMKVGHAGEFIIMDNGAEIASLDMEANAVREWRVDGENYGWLDNDMIYSVHDGQLIVYDFDGLNRRELSRNVSSHYPVGITENKWLYYFSDGELMRERIIK